MIHDVVVVTKQQQHHDDVHTVMLSLDFSKTIKYLYVGDSFTEHLIHPLDDDGESSFQMSAGRSYTLHVNVPYPGTYINKI